MRKYFQNLSVAGDSLIKEITGRRLKFQPLKEYILHHKPSQKRSIRYNGKTFSG